MIGLCTDSNSQLPLDLARRYGIEVVPLTVSVGGHAFSEGEDLDADGFWALVGRRGPPVTTASPGPGRFAAAYAALADRGASAVLSIHVGSAVSATLQSARLGAALAPVPVRLVDTGTASFGVACCVWEAAEALSGGATMEGAAAAAEAVAIRTGNVFVLTGPRAATRGGRLAPSHRGPLGRDPGVPLLSLVAGRMVEVSRVRTIPDSPRAMADYVLGAGPGLRVGVGVADPGSAPLWGELEERLAAAPEVQELVRYRIGPSVGAHTGPGTTGAYFYRRE